MTANELIPDIVIGGVSFYPIPKFIGYSINVDGDIVSHHRVIKYTKKFYGKNVVSSITVKQQVLRYFIDTNGYKCVRVSIGNDKSKNLKIHRILLTVFRYKDGCERLTVNHIDGIKLNNKLENLEWATYAENNVHALNKGLTRLGINRPASHVVLHKEYGIFITVKEAAEMIGITYNRLVYYLVRYGEFSCFKIAC